MVDTRSQTLEANLKACEERIRNLVANQEQIKAELKEELRQNKAQLKGEMSTMKAAMDKEFEGIHAVLAGIHKLLMAKDQAVEGEKQIDKMGTGDSSITGPKPFSDAIHIHKKFCCWNDACKVFDNMSEKNTFTWNSSNGPGSSLEFLWDPGRFKPPEVGASTVVRLRQVDEDNGDSSLGYFTDKPELHKVCKGRGSCSIQLNGIKDKASQVDVQMKAFHEAELKFSKQSVVNFGFESITFRRRKEIADKQNEMQQITGLVKGILVEVKNKDKIGGAYLNSEAICCTPVLANDGSCKVGEVIIRHDPDNPGWPQRLHTNFEGKSEEAKMVLSTVEINRTGMYYLYFMFCDPELLGTLISGRTVWRNPESYLPGKMTPLMTFYGLMSLAYLSLGLWFLRFLQYWKDIIQLHYHITAVIGLGMCEMAFWYFEYANFNATGSRPMGITIWAVTFSAVKKTVSRLLLLVVSMGFGVVRPTLGGITSKVLLLGLVYFVASEALELVEHLGNINDFSGKARVFLVLPVALLDACFILWIFSALSRTLEKFQVRKSLAKLELYRKFTNTLAVSVLISVAWIGYELYFNASDSLSELWRRAWIIPALPVTLIKWFCVNCTMLNLDGVVHCNICGEHKRSGILKHGSLASPEEEVCLNQNGSEVTGKSKASCSQNLASKKSTAVGFDERMLLHFEVELKSHPHPERPDRLRAIAASLSSAGIFPGKCHPILAREITRGELEKVHSVENIESVELTSHAISSYFTPDTYANTHSACAARLAAGLCADLATAIFSGRVKNGFALVRPPGHHAGVNQAMGFCLHNNAAIAASAALVAGAKKVLIVDWDVHHGNGTQEIFEKNKSVLYISLHRHEGGNFYPGTGAADQVGSMGAEGYCVNIPWSRGGVGDNDYFFAFQHVVLPIASKFAPDITIISAGFDAARGDPLGCCDVTPAGYAQMTQMLNSVSSGKLLVILEGGYNLRSISSSATAVVKVLLGESPCVVEHSIPSRSGLRTVLEVLKIQMNFWPALGPIFSELQSRWGFYTLLDKKKQQAKRRKCGAPVWWKLGRKRLLYHIICEKHRRKLKWW